MEAFDWLIVLNFEHLSVDGCCVKVSCGCDNTGPDPTERGETECAVFIEDHGLPAGAVLAGANLHDTPLLKHALACFARFASQLPDQIIVHLDASDCFSGTREILIVLGFAWQFLSRCLHWNQSYRTLDYERRSSWSTCGFGILRVDLERTATVQQTWTSLVNATVVLRRFI